MALEEFEKENFNSRQKGYRRMRSIMDFGMGLLWVGMGVFLIFIQEFSPSLAVRYDDLYMKIFGAVCIIYGSFRIYRGIKKDYYVER
jgi:hypothetical protein